MLRACHDLATGIGQHNTDIDSWKSAGMPRLTPDDYQRFPTVAPDHRYAYGSHPQQFAELTLPPTAPPHPVVILVHGGCYRAMYDLRPLGALAADLADAGFAVWNIEYRRYGNGGEFPRMFLDVATAADHLRLIASEHHLDLERVIAMGHSAGGHLALWLAGRPKIPPESPLYSVRSFADQGGAGAGAPRGYQARRRSGSMQRCPAERHGRRPDHFSRQFPRRLAPRAAAPRCPTDDYRRRRRHRHFGKRPRLLPGGKVLRRCCEPA